VRGKRNWAKDSGGSSEKRTANTQIADQEDVERLWGKPLGLETEQKEALRRGEAKKRRSQKLVGEKCCSQVETRGKKKGIANQFVGKREGTTLVGGWVRTSCESVFGTEKWFVSKEAVALKWGEKGKWEIRTAEGEEAAHKHIQRWKQREMRRKGEKNKNIAKGSSFRISEGKRKHFLLKYKKKKKEPQSSILLPRTTQKGRYAVETEKSCNRLNVRKGSTTSPRPDGKKERKG